MSLASQSLRHCQYGIGVYYFWRCGETLFGAATNMLLMPDFCSWTGRSRGHVENCSPVSDTSLALTCDRDARYSEGLRCLRSASAACRVTPAKRVVRRDCETMAISRTLCASHAVPCYRRSSSSVRPLSETQSESDGVVSVPDDRAYQPAGTRSRFLNAYAWLTSTRYTETSANHLIL